MKKNISEKLNEFYQKCACECGEYVNSGNNFIRGHNMLGAKWFNSIVYINRYF